MRITRPRATKISQLAVDADLDMAAHNILLNATQTVDGKDVSGLTDEATLLASINASVEVAKIANAQLVDIAWAKVLKAGSSIADLATRSAGDLNSGDLLAARMTTNIIAAIAGLDPTLTTCTFDTPICIKRDVENSYMDICGATTRDNGSYIKVIGGDSGDIATAEIIIGDKRVGQTHASQFRVKYQADGAIGIVFTIDKNGNIITVGTVDGRDVSTDGTKLDTIETNAKDDLTGAQIKTLYQAEANAYTDVKNTKLAGIEDNATADQTGAQIKALYEAEANAFTDAKNTKLAGIENNATADQTAAEINALLTSGIISLWSGAISAIPTGYVLCDGASSTPNLTDRFIIHADADAEGVRDVGEIGGAMTHTLTIAELAAHTHTFPVASNASADADQAEMGVTFNRNVATSSTGSGNAHSILNKYHALAYIMKT